ncbi:MAG: hypothetical protein FGF51_08195 [Candidatus Brockarchaeota archaeon]|nr:hypothetical protein [Candidatus Brockarchaeota archaeon]
MRTSGPVIAVPGHYEDVRLLFPEHERSFKVLFPAYDPIIIEGWIIHVNISSTSLNVGETLEASYLAEYCSPWGGGPEPLNATLILEAPDSFEPLNSLERKLDVTHTSGVFSLKAVKPGTCNITLRLEGNAVFANTGSKKETYVIQIVSPPAPSLSVEIVERDTSVLKHAKLVLRLRNSGGGPARNIVLEASGSHLENVSRSLGSIEAGESRDFELTLRLLQPSSLARIVVKYSDDDGNPYLVGLETMVSTETFWVPEHFEEYTVIVPEHEETLRVFVPGYEAATHVRFYALWDERILGEAIFYAERVHSPFPYETNLSMGLIPIPVPGLGVELGIGTGRQALTEAGVKIMVKSIEPYYEYLDILNEDDILTLTGADKQSLRSGNISSDYRVEPLKPYWVESSSVVLNATQLALYQAKMEGVKKTNPDIDYDYKETVADVRTMVGRAEPGYVALIYRPLKIVGEGPLKTVRVRNLARIGLDYRVNVETFIPTVFGRVSDEKGWKYLCLNGMEDAVLLSSSLDSYKREVNVNLTCNGRLVAGARFILDPESSPFWKGFWDGLASQAWKIALTGVVMVILTVASKGTVGALALKLAVLTILSATIVINALSQYNELGQIVFTSHALREIGGIIANHANEFKALGYVETTSILNRAADDVQKLVEAVGTDLASILDFLSRVCVDMSIDEWGILLGLREAEPYNKGYVWGKAVGNAISLLVFIAGFCHLATSGATPASLGAKAKAVLQGAWNWLTPALTDAIGVIRNTPKLAKGYSMLITIFSNAKKMGKSIVEVLKMDTRAVMDLADISGRIWEKIMDAAKRRKLSDNAVKGFTDLCSKLGEGALKELGENIDVLLSKSGGFVDEFFKWTGRVEADPQWAVETTGKLSRLSGEELDGLGKALAKVGESFENGLKLFNNYFKTIELEQYDRGIANALAEAVSKNVEMLDAWGRAIDDGYSIYFGKAPDTYLVPTPEDQSKIQGKVVYVYVLDGNTKDIIVKGSRKLTGQKVFKFGKSDIKSGNELLVLINKFTVEDFYNKYAVKDKIIIEGGNAYYKDVNGKALKQLGPGVLDGYLDETYIDFPFKDLKGKAELEDAPEYRLRVSDSGYQMLIDSLGERNAVGRAELKTVKDDSGKIVAELLFVQTPEGPLRGIYLLSRSLPEGWKWCLSNEENIVPLESSQVKVSVDDLLWRILDPQTYERLKAGLEGGMARVTAVFDTLSGKAAVWTGSPSLNFMVPEGATVLSKLYIVWADGFEHEVGNTIFKLSGGNVEISGPEGSIMLQADYRLSLPTTGKTILLMDLPFSGNFKPAFDIYVDDSGNLVTKPTLKHVLQGEVQNSWDVVKCEYQQTYYIAKGMQLDQVLIIYKDDGGVKIISLTQYLPRNIETNPNHAVAVIHVEDVLKEKGYQEMKYEDYRKTPKGDRYYDITAVFQGEEILVEAKTGMEKSFDKYQITKDTSYLKNKKDILMIYYFDNPPSNDGAKRYLQCIRQTYLENPELEGKIFVIIGGDKMVEPTDSSLDPYMP